MSNLSLVLRDPFAEFDNLVRTVFGPVVTRPVERPTGFVPPVEVVRDGDDAVVRVELPGVDVNSDVTVQVDAGRLVVRGERRDERAADQNGRGLRELRYGAFRRSFSLPAHVTADAVSASYDAGVLSIRVAGAYSGSSARRIAIDTAPKATEPANQPTEPDQN